MDALSLRIVVVLVVINYAAAIAQPATQGSPSPPPPSAQPSAGAQTGVLVPGGTIVAVSLVEPVSSATAKEGDQIAIRVVKEVDIGGLIVVPAEAPGHATVANVDSAGSNGHGGKLGLTIDWVYSQDGGKVQLSATNHASDNGQQTGAASTATILSYVLLGPLGLFAHNFVRGRDVTIDTKKVFSVFVDHDIHVVTSSAATSPTAGFDK